MHILNIINDNFLAKSKGFSYCSSSTISEEFDIIASIFQHLHWSLSHLQHTSLNFKTRYSWLSGHIWAMPYWSNLFLFHLSIFLAFLPKIIPTSFYSYLSLYWQILKESSVSESFIYQLQRLPNSSHSPKLHFHSFNHLLGSSPHSSMFKIKSVLCSSLSPLKMYQLSCPGPKP